MKFRVFYDDTGFRLRGWRKIKELLNKVITEEGKISGDLNFIFTTDKNIRDLNAQFLKHDYFTDVISFTYCSEPRLDGEVYISTETVKENARNYKVSYRREIIRVMIHGTLHLCGYKDSSTFDRKRMREREDYWIEKLERMTNGI